MRDLQRKLPSFGISETAMSETILKLHRIHPQVEIKNNIEVFRRASELLPDLFELALLKGKSRDKNNPKDGLFAP